MRSACSAEGGPLRGHANLPRQDFQFAHVPGLVGAHAEHVPRAGPALAFEARPGLDEQVEPFDGVDAPDEEEEAPAFGEGRHVCRERRAERHFGDGVLEAEGAHPARLLGGGRVQEGRAAQGRALVEQPGRGLFPAFVGHGPGGEHAVGGPDDGDAAAFGPEVGAQEPGRPEGVDVDEVGAPAGGEGVDDARVAGGVEVLAAAAHPQAAVVALGGELAEGLAAEDGGAGGAGHARDDVQEPHVSRGRRGRARPSLRWCRPCPGGGFRGPWRGGRRRGGP